MAERAIWGGSAGAVFELNHHQVRAMFDRLAVTTGFKMADVSPVQSHEGFLSSSVKGS